MSAVPGVQKAAGLKAPPAKYKGWPGTRLGRWSLVFPSGPVALVVRFTGKPVRAVMIELSVHDPNTLRDSPGWLRNDLPAPKGSSYTTFALNTLRASKAPLARS